MSEMRDRVIEEMEQILWDYKHNEIMLDQARDRILSIPELTIVERDDERGKGILIDYLRYLDGEGLFGDEARLFRSEHYSSPYKLGAELYQLLLKQGWQGSG